MPMPQDYQNASQDFDQFLAHAREALGLATRHQTYTTVQCVLVVFRRRLRPEKILRFADVLPAVLRALFVQCWMPDEFTLTFGDRESLNREVQLIRQHHNFSPDNAIAIVTATIRQFADAARLDAVLDTLPHDARDYWHAGSSGTARL